MRPKRMNKTDFRQRAVRHGEIMLIPVDRLPENLEVVEQGKRVIVGHSESGHHHVAVCEAADLTLLRPAGADSPDLFLKVAAPARIEHLKEFDRHETKTLEAGYLRIVNKTEYDYFTKVNRRVLD